MKTTLELKFTEMVKMKCKKQLDIFLITNPNMILKTNAKKGSTGHTARTIEPTYYHCNQMRNTANETKIRI